MFYYFKTLSASHYPEKELLPDKMLPGNGHEPVSLKGQYRFYHKLGLYYVLKQDHEQTYHYRKLIFNLTYDNHAVFTEMQRLVSLRNYLTATRNFNRLQEFDHHIGIYRQFDYATNFSKRLFVFESYYTLLFGRLLDEGKFDEVTAMDAEVSAEIESLKEYARSADFFVVHYQLFCAWFALGNYVKALSWLNKILVAATLGNVPHKLHMHCKVLAILTHYELGNTGLLPYSLRSLYRSLKRSSNSAFDLVVMQFVRELSKITNPEDMRVLFVKTRNNLSAAAVTDTLNRDFPPFDFVTWFDEKLKAKVAVESGHKKVAVA
ncbi:MAG TPA: hypothetical protein VI731_07990 [Bacteroidia bacterium]|nr:hypothetical protein [Bacteroidia bacterium]